MHVFDVLDFNWLTCWVNTLTYVYLMSHKYCIFGPLNLQPLVLLFSNVF
jgi:hypothetical protein